MMLFLIKIYAARGFHIFFPLFLFFSVIYCGYTRVNNLFHLSILCLLLVLKVDFFLCRQLFSDWRFNIGLLLISLMLSYFCITTLWSTHPENLVSEIIHSIYLILFILMFRFMFIQGRRLIAFWAVISGIAVLAALTFLTVDKESILTARMLNGFSGAPSNIIDLAGYFCLGVFISLIIMRDTGIRWLTLLVLVLLLAILLTQSRGPLLSLTFAFGIFIILQSQKVQKYHYLIVAFIAAIILALLFMTRFGNIFLQRVKSSYQQSFIRFNIWHHTLDMVSQKPFFGWGLNKELSFINTLGDLITTTHSIYLASLLKGGVLGMLLLMSVMIYGILMAKQQFEYKHGLEGSLFLFAVNFYITQGMFIISNPAATWEIFWFPLAVVMTLPVTLPNSSSLKKPSVVDSTVLVSCK